jgi:hypothetical protein
MAVFWHVECKEPMTPARPVFMASFPVETAAEAPPSVHWTV